jgi:hypothetical protein
MNACHTFQDEILIISTDPLSHVRLTAMEYLITNIRVAAMDAE